MFGYVRPLREELKVRDLNRWQADYCGLCRCLGKRYGFFTRFLLSYDMTFLYVLLTMGQGKGETARCWCPASLVRCKTCTEADAAMEYAADLTTLLSYWKLRDEMQDGGFFRRRAAGVGAWFFSRAYRKASARRPEMDRLIRERLAALSAMERERSGSIDRTADAFAAILKGCADWWENPRQRRPAEQVLYHVGRYVYLLDALDDLRRDCAKDSYNPLRYRFSPQNGTLSEQDLSELRQGMDASLDLAASAFELMDRGGHGAVAENILYFGLPAVLEAVSKGTFRRRKRRA
ncbi:MAG: DUF5685 family protein [Oscillospiraceae bacterium]|nr:DUF5685 family protein [Oscillospiraceae bacterium]